MLPEINTKPIASSHHTKSGQHVYKLKRGKDDRILIIFRLDIFIITIFTQPKQIFDGNV